MNGTHPRISLLIHGWHAKLIELCMREIYGTIPGVKLIRPDLLISINSGCLLIQSITSKIERQGI